MKYFLRALETAAVITGDMMAAAADGKITVMEMAAIIKKLARIWKIDVEIDVPVNVANMANPVIFKGTLPDDMP